MDFDTPLQNNREFIIADRGPFAKVHHKQALFVLGLTKWTDLPYLKSRSWHAPQAITRSCA